MNPPNPPNPHIPTTVIAYLSVKVCALGKILHWLEYDTAIDVLSWSQNVPGVSELVELKIETDIFPACWDGAQVGLCVMLDGDTVRLQWTAVLPDGNDAPDAFIRVRLMRHRNQLGWMAHLGVQ